MERWLNSPLLTFTKVSYETIAGQRTEVNSERVDLVAKFKFQSLIGVDQSSDDSYGDKT